MAEPVGGGGKRPVLLELCGVAKAYDGVSVLEQADLAIEDGEFLVVVGPSGSGKTTVLRMIGGFTDPSAGDIVFDGRSILGVPINRRPFHTVFQDYALFPHMTVAENVGYGLLMQRIAKAESRVRVAEALQLVQLEPLAARYPAQLSGGQRQRVALARAIVCRPRIVLLDEPLGALDAALRRQMQGFLKEVQRTIRTTFLFVTHDQEEAITMADRICVMDHGRIVQLGTPAEIYWRPNCEYVARFFGDNNLLPGTVVGQAGRTLTVSTALGEVSVASPATAPNHGTTVMLAIRPEVLRLGPAAAAPAANRFAARVAEMAFVGPTYHVKLAPVTAPDMVLTAKLPSSAAGPDIEVGGEITVFWVAGDGHVVPA